MDGKGDWDWQDGVKQVYGSYRRGCFLYIALVCFIIGRGCFVIPFPGEKDHNMYHSKIRRWWDHLVWCGIAGVFHREGCGFRTTKTAPFGRPGILLLSHILTIHIKRNYVVIRALYTLYSHPCMSPRFPEADIRTSSSQRHSTSAVTNFSHQTYKGRKGGRSWCQVFDNCLAHIVLPKKIRPKQ